MTQNGQNGNGCLITVRDLKKAYRRAGEDIHVLCGLRLDIKSGTFVAFMGPSGSGKTTLLNLLGGIDVPTAGSIKVGDVDVCRLSGNALTNWRARHIGFVFQMYNLIPVLTAFQNVELPLLLTGLSKKQRQEHVHLALSLVGLQDRAKHYPRELSGGQEQRVGIARAIVSDPTVLLCDEPTGDLDRHAADEVMELLKNLNQKHGKTIVMVTHDSIAARHADTVLNLDKGSFVEQTLIGGAQ